MALARDYIFTHVLRDSSERTYLAATRALLRYFGDDCAADSIDHRAVLGWRRKELERGLTKESWNTYSSHLRTIWGYAMEHGTLVHATVNPFKKTSVVPPKRPSKTVARDAIKLARSWLRSLITEERTTGKRARITPAWFWLSVYEMFYYTGIRLNALLTLRYRDVDWANKIITVQADTEKTHREFSIPIAPGLEPHISRILEAARETGFEPDDQLFNVNRFSRHYRSKVMNTDQIEGMYKKLTRHIGIRMSPHRFRHTIATDLMKQPERNIHITKSLLNHSNIATTLSYIEVDYEHMRAVLHERSLMQGAIAFERRVDEHAGLGTGPDPHAERLALPPPAATEPSQIVETHPVRGSRLLCGLPGSQDLKLPAPCSSLDSERSTLEQAMLPAGTALSHELPWDGPGTWWEDLGLPPSQSVDEYSEHSVLLELMARRVGIKSYSW